MIKKIGRPTGFEPATSGTTNRRSNQLSYGRHTPGGQARRQRAAIGAHRPVRQALFARASLLKSASWPHPASSTWRPRTPTAPPAGSPPSPARSEEHTSELQSLMRISYAVFCLKTKNTKKQTNYTEQ